MYDPKAVDRALAYIQYRLQDENLSEVARRTGIGRQTIIRFAHGNAKHPKPETIATLQKYLEKREKDAVA